MFFSFYLHGQPPLCTTVALLLRGGAVEEEHSRRIEKLLHQVVRHQETHIKAWYWLARHYLKINRYVQAAISALKVLNIDEVGCMRWWCGVSAASLSLPADLLELTSCSTFLGGLFASVTRKCRMRWKRSGSHVSTTTRTPRLHGATSQLCRCSPTEKVRILLATLRQLFLHRACLEDARLHMHFGVPSVCCILS